MRFTSLVFYRVHQYINVYAVILFAVHLVYSLSPVLSLLNHGSQTYLSLYPSPGSSETDLQHNFGIIIHEEIYTSPFIHVQIYASPSYSNQMSLLSWHQF